MDITMDLESTDKAPKRKHRNYGFHFSGVCESTNNFWKNDEMAVLYGQELIVNSQLFDIKFL